jgi:arginine deiminase
MLRPTAELQPTESNTGVRARYIHNPLINLYFTRDQSITTPRGHIICRMSSSQRAAETSIIEFCYRLLGRAPFLRIGGKGHLEGGDYFPAGDFSIIGCGMRTNTEAIRQMMAADAFGHDTVVVVHDRKHWQAQMHLDTYFNLIDKDLCTMAESRLLSSPEDKEFLRCDIFERSAGKPYRKTASKIPFTDFLRSRGFTILPIPREDEPRFACNFLTVAPRKIMAVAGQSEGFRKALADCGVDVEWIPLDNLICGYGAAHCMTQVLDRR